MRADAMACEQADELLAVRCQLGERAAFDQLVRRWSEPLKRYVARVAGDPDATDELVQDIWVRVVQGMGRLRDSSRFRAWLFGIAHRTLMDRLRTLYATPVETSTELDEIASEETDSDREQACRDVERGLQRLPLPERDVLTLFYLEELALSEVAAILAVPVGTVKSRLFRARTSLRQALVQGDLTT